MTENQLDAPDFQEAPEKKNNTILWIILGVLAALLICCCVLAVVGSFVYIPSWNSQFNF